MCPDFFIEGFEDSSGTFKLDLFSSFDIGFGHCIGDEDGLTCRVMFGGDFDEVSAANGMDLKLGLQEGNLIVLGRETKVEGLNRGRKGFGAEDLLKQVFTTSSRAGPDGSRFDFIEVDFQGRSCPWKACVEIPGDTEEARNKKESNERQQLFAHAGETSPGWRTFEFSGDVLDCAEE